MRILIVGCGSIGRRHARNARALGAEVVLCDINESRMREFGEDYECMTHKIRHHDSVGYTDAPVEWVAVSVLRKCRREPGA